MSHKFVEVIRKANAGPSTAFGAKNASYFAQDDKVLLNELKIHDTS